MADTVVDAFILCNEREEAVFVIVEDLLDHGVTAYCRRRDASYGEEWEPLEAQLRDARAIVVFLGEHGWGPTHRKFAGRAVELQKRIVPVVIGPIAEDALSVAGELFRKRRCVDLRERNESTLLQLVLRPLAFVRMLVAVAPIPRYRAATVRERCSRSRH